MDWRLFEQWATNKAIRFGMSDDWIDFMLYLVRERVDEERRTDAGKMGSGRSTDSV